ncbi:MAG TPA: class I SAM-dependent methyltransferase, partial [Bacteroidia bacterium]|nr:class I SAM-dependent methyltransferase [Bacteroidia bacterium]
MLLLTPEHWKDYELLDCGDFEKLERFGKFVLRRPEPQAVWGKVWSEKEWQQQTDITFIAKSSQAGEWKKKTPSPENWQVQYNYNNLQLKFKLGLTSFKHVGLFPEQAANWDYIYSAIKGMKIPQPKVLNLFAYTGASSLAAKAAGADVVHVDSVKQVVSWARENMELSGLDNIRWTVEDAAKFVEREVKRGKKYNGIILDPPAYGIGAKGERWKLEDMINGLMADLAQLLDKDNHFFLINTYSLGFSSLIL